MKEELNNTGFCNVLHSNFNDSNILEFSEVEDFNCWENCFGFECQKPNL